MDSQLATQHQECCAASCHGVIEMMLPAEHHCIILYNMFKTARIRFICLCPADHIIVQQQNRVPVDYCDGVVSCFILLAAVRIGLPSFCLALRF